MQLYRNDIKLMVQNLISNLKKFATLSTNLLLIIWLKEKILVTLQKCTLLLCLLRYCPSVYTQ